MTITEADVQFFYKNAPSSYNPKTETEEQGRQRGARDLALAEARLKAGPYYVVTEPDADAEPDSDWTGPTWTVAIYRMDGATGSTQLSIVGGVQCEEGDSHLRVTAAQLALDLPIEVEAN